MTGESEPTRFRAQHEGRVEAAKAEGVRQAGAGPDRSWLGAHDIELDPPVHLSQTGNGRQDSFGKRLERQDGFYGTRAGNQVPGGPFTAVTGGPRPQTGSPRHGPPTSRRALCLCRAHSRGSGRSVHAGVSQCPRMQASAPLRERSDTRLKASAVDAWPSTQPRTRRPEDAASGRAGAP